jgi:hypothetical protein
LDERVKIFRQRLEHFFKIPRLRKTLVRFQFRRASGILG